MKLSICNNTKLSSDKSASDSQLKGKYNQTFVQYWFTFSKKDNKQRLMCMLCNKILATES